MTLNILKLIIVVYLVEVSLIDKKKKKIIVDNIGRCFSKHVDIKTIDNIKKAEIRYDYLRPRGEIVLTADEV